MSSAGANVPGPGQAIEDLCATEIAGVFVIRSRVIDDPRGQFLRAFDRSLLHDEFGERVIEQVNISITGKRGNIRGMHFQRGPAAETKWVRCLAGRAYDVAVDLRRGSPTFLRHVAVELSPGEANAIMIPEGCAHGFQALEDQTTLLYLHSAPYVPGREGGVRWDDPALAIVWPLEPVEISERDRSHPLIRQGFEGL